ncbi:MAG: hypothetical protein IH600_14785 [Bacteroidetes bacterium]|nr:hypothetical protein [Bacteroidota bacterium]
MNLALFSELSVREYYDSNVIQAAERRVFSIPDEELCARTGSDLIQNILDGLSPERLVLLGAVHETTHRAGDQSVRIRRWMEYSGSVRLLTLRPRQYYASPPHVSALQPSSTDQPGSIIIEHSVRSIAEETQFDEFCAAEYKKITDYAVWVNEDLDYYEQSARSWLLTLVETKKKRLCIEHEDEAELSAGELYS